MTMFEGYRDVKEGDIDNCCVSLWLCLKAIEMENGVETDQRVTTKVIVTILDEDDNSPTFQQSLYNISVLEMDSSSYVNSSATVPGLNMRVADPDDVSASHIISARFFTEADNFGVTSPKFSALTISSVQTILSSFPVLFSACF